MSLLADKEPKYLKIQRLVINTSEEKNQMRKIEMEIANIESFMSKKLKWVKPD